MHTFGQHLAHVSSSNFLWCSQAKGDKDPNAGKNLEKAFNDEGRVHEGAERRGFAYCDPAYTALTRRVRA